VGEEDSGGKERGSLEEVWLSDYVFPGGREKNGSIEREERMRRSTTKNYRDRQPSSLSPATREKESMVRFVAKPEGALTPDGTTRRNEKIESNHDAVARKKNRLGGSSN